LRQSYTHHLFEPVPRGSAGHGVAVEVAQAGKGRPGPVFELYFAFCLEVVGSQDLVHASGIGAASGIFQEHGVIEIGKLLAIETEFLSHAHTKDTAADGVSHGLPFGEIEGHRERRDYFGKEDGSFQGDGSR
jgi:hypothetical protein